MVFLEKTTEPDSKQSSFKRQFNSNSNSFKLKFHPHHYAKTSHHRIDESLTSHTEKREKYPSDQTLLDILNRFGFYLFLLYIIFLNIFCLYMLPYHIRKPLSIDAFD